MKPTTMRIAGTAIILSAILAMLICRAPAWAFYLVLAMTGHGMVITSVVFSTRR